MSITSEYKIDRIKFSMMEPLDIVRNSVVEVNNKELFTYGKLEPVVHGPLDRKLGLSVKDGICETCGEKAADCVGHFGFIKLALPVFHYGFFRDILTTLQCCCKYCSRAMMKNEGDRIRSLNLLRNPNLNHLVRKNLVKNNITQCKRSRICPYCHQINGNVKKTAPLRITHFVYSEKDDTPKVQLEEDCHQAALAEPEIVDALKFAQDLITPDKALKIFEKIPDEDAILLGFNPPLTRPEHMILTFVPVPPAPIRPSVINDPSMGSNEDDVTMSTQQIVHLNNLLKDHLEKGQALGLVMENWDFLQVKVGLHINSEMPGLPRNMAPTKPTRALAQRLKGKQGRFRGNLSGKRVDFSGRTVISPDPNLRIDQVGVPKLIAMHLTYPERVNEYNIETLRELVRRGSEQHPGANFVRKKDGQQFFLKIGRRDVVAKELEVGDVVERHLIDGDVVLFNRQPSLHRISIMAHRVKVFPWRTLRFNECVCAPYNADFDGDEMNIHVPQTQEARAEAYTLMSVCDVALLSLSIFLYLHHLLFFTILLSPLYLLSSLL